MADQFAVDLCWQMWVHSVIGAEDGAVTTAPGQVSNAGDAGPNICKSRKRVLSQHRTVDIVAHALDNSRQRWRPWSLFPFSPKKIWEVPESPRDWRVMDLPLWILYSGDVSVLFFSLFFLFFFLLFFSVFSLFWSWFGPEISSFPFFNVRSLHLTYTIWIFRNL